MVLALSAVDAEGGCGCKRSRRTTFTELLSTWDLPVVRISKLRTVAGGHYLEKYCFAPSLLLFSSKCICLQPLSEAGYLDNGHFGRIRLATFNIMRSQA